MFTRARVPKARKTTIHDVWVAAKLAATHAGGSHSILSTMLTRMAQQEALLAQLVAHVAELHRDVRPVDTDTEPATALPPPSWSYGQE